MKMKKDMAKKILGNVPPEQCFWINNGPIVKSVKQLTSAVKKMKDSTFMHHVNKDKNDFSAWIKHVVGDTALANSISKLKTKKAIVEQLNKRLKTLKKVCG